MVGATERKYHWAEFAELVPGVTHRMADSWSYAGLLHPERPRRGSGIFRSFSIEDVVCARLILKLRTTMLLSSPCMEAVLDLVRRCGLDALAESILAVPSEGDPVLLAPYELTAWLARCGGTATLVDGERVVRGG